MVLLLFVAASAHEQSFQDRQAIREMREFGDEVKFLRRINVKTHIECKKHSDCKTKFCDQDKQCDECSACEDQFDSVDAKCPPCATNVARGVKKFPPCKSHAECTKTHFCDESKKCDECRACENGHDSVDGKCPSCKR